MSQVRNVRLQSQPVCTHQGYSCTADGPKFSTCSSETSPRGQGSLTNLLKLVALSDRKECQADFNKKTSSHSQMVLVTRGEIRFTGTQNHTLPHVHKSIHTGANEESLKGSVQDDKVSILKFDTNENTEIDGLFDNSRSRFQSR